MRVNRRSNRSKNRLKSSKLSFPEEKNVLKKIDSNKKKDVLFILNLEIGGGKSDKIQFKQGNKAEDLSLEFCKKHNLNIRVYDFIVKALNQKKQEVRMKLEQKKLKKKSKKNNFFNENSNPAYNKTFQDRSQIYRESELGGCKATSSMLDTQLIDEENEKLFSFKQSKKKENQAYSGQKKQSLSPYRKTYQRYVPLNKTYFLARKSIETDPELKKSEFEFLENELSCDEKTKKNFFVKNRSLSRNSRNSHKNSLASKSRSKTNTPSSNTYLKKSKYSVLKKEISEASLKPKRRHKRRSRINISYSGFQPERSNSNSLIFSRKNSSKESYLLTKTPKASDKSKIVPLPKPQKTEKFDLNVKKKIMTRTFSHKNFSRSKHPGLKRSHLLYISGKRMHDNKMKKAKSYLKGQEDNEMEPSFRPTINRASRLIANRGGSYKRKDKSVYERLIEKGEIYKSKKVFSRIRKVEDEVRECRFKPEVNKMYEFFFFDFF